MLPENELSWAIWQRVKCQVRVGGKGAYALDLGAVVLVLEHTPGVDNIDWELTKLEQLFNETYIKEKDG